MTGIEEIDRASMTMTVKAGTPLETIQKAADEAGFFFPLDLGSRGSCAIGGNLSTNAGGNRVIRYGMTRELVLGLEVVLPDGTIITSLNKLMKNNAGYDLKHLFIGSEGTLGIITRVVLRLFPKPRSTMAALCALKDYAAVIDLLGAARSGLGPLLSAFEVMWPDYWDVITTRAGVAAGRRRPGSLCAGRSAGHRRKRRCAAFPGLARRADGARAAGDAAVAQSLAQTQAFWACATSAPNSARCWGRTSPTTSALRWRGWTSSSRAARRRWPLASRDARASITAISATAICISSPGSRAFPSSSSRRRRWTRSSMVSSATWAAASPPSTASAR